MSVVFSPDEIKTLREHGIVIFADRVIFEAQPPMSIGELAEVQAQCANDIPKQLVDLWLTTAGGSLDYDLTVNMNGQEEAISFTELFYNGSQSYNTLQGWIEHEQDLAMEVADEEDEDHDCLVRYLPFGGFEYCDRIYATLEPGPEYGHIVAWKQGLPPAWAHQLHQDAICTIGSDLLEAFKALNLQVDPLAPVDDFYTGETLFQYLEERVEEHGLSIELKEKLIAFYRQAVIDWRTPLSDGTLKDQPSLARIALAHAVSTDDEQLVKQLASARVSMEQPLRGDALATELAVIHSSYRAAQALIESGAPVTSYILRDVNDAIPVGLMQLLLKNGALPTVEAIVNCAACGAPDSARAVANACSQDDLRAFDKAKKIMLKDLEKTLTQVRNGKLGHYLGEEGLTERVNNLKNFSID